MGEHRSRIDASIFLGDDRDGTVTISFADIFYSGESGGAVTDDDVIVRPQLLSPT